MQKMMASDNARPEDDGNASVSTGEGSLAGKQKDLGIQIPPVAMFL